MLRISLVLLFCVTLGGSIWYFSTQPKSERPREPVVFELLRSPRELPDHRPIELTPEVLAKLKEIAYQSAREGDVRTLLDCLESGVPLNEPNSRGDTLLTLACYYGHEETVAVLLKQPQIDLEARNKMGLTALSGVAFKGHVGVGKQLVDAGAQVNASNGSGQTPLMFASLTGRIPMVQLLLKAGADPNARDSSGKTALSLAEEQGSVETIAILREAMKK